MSLRTHGAQANERAHFSTTRTLSDFSLLIGVMLVGEYGGTSPSKTVRVEGLLRGVDTFVKEVELMPPTGMGEHTEESRSWERRLRAGWSLPER